MRPPFNSFRPQTRPQRPQHEQNNGYCNQYQNPVNCNQLGMMMGHMNNMPVNPHLYNNQLQPFGLPSHMNNLFQFAVASNNLMGHSLPFVQPNFFPPPQPQLNSFNPLPYPPFPNQHQNQNQHLRPPGFADPRPQVQSSPKGNDFRNKHHKFKGPAQGFQRPRLHPADDSNKKFGFNKDHKKAKGNHKTMQTRLDGSDAGYVAKKKKRPIAWFYTPKEIQQWRESRRKNFPTKLNVENKVKKSVSKSNLEEESKMRRQQLQEILAKQRELGVEVAEVPSHYLSDTEEKAHEDRGDNNGHSLKDGKRGRFQNGRHNKRRHSSQESSLTTRKPTLLEKLLSGDIKRDKSRLLQVFRFMVINSFFNDLPEQPLKLPLVMVEETGCEHAREDEDLTVDVLFHDHNDDDDVNGDDNSCDEAIVR